MSKTAVAFFSMRLSAILASAALADDGRESRILAGRYPLRLRVLKNDINLKVYVNMKFNGGVYKSSLEGPMLDSSRGLDTGHSQQLTFARSGSIQ